MSATLQRLRWRDADPAEGLSAWTKVHLSRQPDRYPQHTLCGLIVPEYPYMEDRDEQIPDGAPTCKRCQKFAW